MVVDGEARIAERPQHRIAKSEAVVQLIGVGSFEVKAGKSDGSCEWTIRRGHQSILQMPKLSQAIHFFGISQSDYRETTPNNIQTKSIFDNADIHSARSGEFQKLAQQNCDLPTQWQIKR